MIASECQAGQPDRRASDLGHGYQSSHISGPGARENSFYLAYQRNNEAQENYLMAAQSIGVC